MGGNVSTLPAASKGGRSGGEHAVRIGVTVGTSPAAAAAEPAAEGAPAEGMSPHVGIGGDEGTAGAAEEDQCRICYEGVLPEAGMDSLISPCHCGGSQRCIHPLCLQKWQVSVVLGTSMHPHNNHKESRHTVCNVCRGTFTSPPPSRGDILRDSVGETLYRMIKPGNLLVHRRMAELPESLSRLPQAITSLMEVKRLHWKESVYLITAAAAPCQDNNSADAAEGDSYSGNPLLTDVGHVMAINLTRNMAEEGQDPPGGAREHLVNDTPGVSLSFFNGGPVCWSRRRLAVVVPPATAPPLPQLPDDEDQQQNQQPSQQPSVSREHPKPMAALTLPDHTSLLLGNVTAALRVVAEHRKESSSGSSSNSNSNDDDGGDESNNSNSNHKDSNSNSSSNHNNSNNDNNRSGRSSNSSDSSGSNSNDGNDESDGSTSEADIAEVRVYCGHAQWGWEQLLGEINRGDWVLCPGTAADAVHPQPKKLWQDVWSRPDVTRPCAAAWLRR